MAKKLDPAAAAAHLRAADPQLAGVIDRAPLFPAKPQRLTSPFEALARAIVFQQLSGKAAETIFQRVATCVAAKAGSFEPQGLAAIPDEQLRTCGLSGAKLAGLRDLAAHALAGKVPTLRELTRMSDEAIVERLIGIRGIGRWTIEMLLIFRLGRADVLPTTDYGVRKGIALIDRLDDLPTPKEVALRGAIWQPYRSIASWYLWRAIEEK